MFDSVSPKEKMFFTEHLALMLKGGLPLTEALEVLKGETKSKVFKKALGDVIKRILEGESLSKSLGQYPGIFDKFFRNIIMVGEESGTLEENLKYLSLSLQSEYALKKKVAGALVYPVLIITMAIGIVSAATIFILPNFIKLFQSLKIKLPIATKILLDFGDFLHKYWFLALAGIIAAIFIYRALNLIKVFRFFFHNIALNFPLVGGIDRSRNLARFSQTFYTLLKSGVSILDALDICIQTTPNEVYKKDIMFIRAGVERGEKLSDGLKKFPKSFPSIFSQMVLVGERSGALEDSMAHLAGFYEAEADDSLKNLSGILEPLLLIFVGLLVAFLALAIILPIYQFTSNLKSR